MIEIFKGWVSAMLCLGIFISFIQLILPKTNLRKYLYSLVGIITVITVIAPVVNLLKNERLEESVSQVIANISEDSSKEYSDVSDYENKTAEMVRENFANNMKADIENKLIEKGIEVKTVDMFLTEEYNIEKMSICIGKINTNTTSLQNVTGVVKYINEEYDLDFSKIEVIEEGD